MINPSDDIDRLKTNLAAIEHERWSDWQKWCHEVLRRELPLDFSPRLDMVLERWDKQIETPYSELSDKEKASDMEQVDRYWPLIEDYIITQTTKAKNDLLDRVEKEVIGENDSRTIIETYEGEAVTADFSRNILRAEQRERLQSLTKESGE